MAGIDLKGRPVERYNWEDGDVVWTKRGGKSIKGSPRSGNRAHAGRPGRRGGSAPSGNMIGPSAAALVAERGQDIMIKRYGEGFMEGHVDGRQAHTWIMPDGTMTGEVGSHRESFDELIGEDLELERNWDEFNYRAPVDAAVNEAGWARVQMNNNPASNRHSLVVEVNGDQLTSAQTRTFRDIGATLKPNSQLELHWSEIGEQASLGETQHFFGKDKKGLLRAWAKQRLAWWIK